MDKSTVAKMMAKLEANGYITRSPNPKDNRSIDVCPTSKSQELYPLLKKIGEDWSLKLTKNLSVPEKTVFIEMLKKVTDNAVNM